MATLTAQISTEISVMSPTIARSYRNTANYGNSWRPDYDRGHAMSEAALRPFHLAIPVDDLARCRRFYGELMGCPEGRSSTRWVDFDFFGHQLVIHEVDEHPGLGGRNRVDGEDVPVPHFGVVLTMDAWADLRDQLVAAGVEFEIEPTIRFAGEVGEQATMFLFDPAGNALEFKAMADPTALFAK